MEREDIIRSLFKKLSYDTLESLESIMMFSKIDKNMYAILRSELLKKYEENRDEFEGRRGYDNIARILNLDLSEISNNLNDYSKDELLILKQIIEEGTKNLSTTTIESKLKLVLDKYRSTIYQGLPDDLLFDEINELLEKLTILELDAIYAICKTAYSKLDYALDRAINLIYSKKRLSKWKETEVPIDQINAGINSLLNNKDKFNEREKKFIKDQAELAGFNLCNFIKPTDIEESFMVEAIYNLKNNFEDDLEYANMETHCL